MTGEVGDGWLGTCFMPEAVMCFWMTSKPAQKSRSQLKDIDIQTGGYFEISDDVIAW